MTRRPTASQNKPDRRALWIAAAVAFVTLGVFAPCMGHRFLTFDDQIYVTENPHVLGGWSWDSFRWAFTTFRTGNWHPVTWLSHITDCQLFGSQSWGHHLTNVLLHATNAALVFLLLRRLTGEMWRCAAVAALFALHPAHVESVAWVAERKDLLSALFFLLTMWAYVGYAAAPTDRGGAPSAARRGRLYVLALLFFVIGLMAKPMIVTLPFVLLLLDYWPLRRKAYLEKAPLFALSAVSCWVTILAQSANHAVADIASLPFAERLEHAAISYFQYVGMMVFPRDLAVFYPYANHESLALVAISLTAIAFIFAVAINQARAMPFLLVGWLWFVGMLVPVIGLVQVGSQALADRYTYLPSIGFFLAVVWWIPARAKYLAIPIGAAVVVATSLQLTYWRDTQTLFERTAAVTKHNYMALALLASVADGQGNLAQAEERCAAALRAKPDYAPAYFFLGRIRERQGRWSEAIAAYSTAAELAPYFEQARLNLGVAQARTRDFAGAETNYQAAIEIDPESASAHNDLGKLRQLQGRAAESEQEYRAALSLDPKLEQAHNNLGIVYLQQGKMGEGTMELEAALRLNPTNAQTELNLAMAFSQQQKKSEAAAAAAQAQKLATEQGDAEVAQRAAQILKALAAPQ